VAFPPAIICILAKNQPHLAAFCDWLNKIRFISFWLEIAGLEKTIKIS